MNVYYVLKQDFYAFDYLFELDSLPLTLNTTAIYKNEWQHISDTEEIIDIVNRTSEKLTDFYYIDIPLISHKFKILLDDLDVKNTFYKPIFLRDMSDISRDVFEYYLMLAGEVDCVNWDNVDYIESPLSKLKEIKGGFEIDRSKTGDFKIFKIKGVLARFYIINEELKERIVEEGLKGISIVETTQYRD